MKLIKCVHAYAAILELSNKDMDCKSAYALMKLERQLKDHVEFFLKEERKLAEQYAKKEDGKPVFTDTGFEYEDPSKREEYNEKHRELENLDVDFRKFGSLKLDSMTPRQMDALDGFIKIEVE